MSAAFEHKNIRDNRSHAHNHKNKGTAYAAKDKTQVKIVVDEKERPVHRRKYTGDVRGNAKFIPRRRTFSTMESSNPDIVINAIKSLKRGDVRSTVVPSTAVQNKTPVEYTSHGAPIVVSLSDGAIFAVAASLVSKALTRGMENKYALPALQQLSQVFKTSALNSEPVITDVPGYVDVINKALAPRTVLHKGAAFNYSWTSTSASISAPSQLSYGNNSNAGIVNYGYIQSGTSNPLGLPTVLPVGQPSSDEQKIAFSKLTAALARGDNGTCAPLTKAESKKLNYDSSAFAGQTIVDGFAIGGQGGTVSRLGSEASINFPIFARFAEVSQSYRDYNRACNVNTEAGGGPMELGMFITQYRTHALEKIKKPVIKFVDALSLMHVYFTTWKLAVEQFINTADFELLMTTNFPAAQDAVRQRCIPVSFVEAQLALRNEFMKSFAETQYGTQSLGPTTDPNEAWLGYACGVGTCPNYDVESLYMSGPLAENLRALSAVTVYDVDETRTESLLASTAAKRKLTDEEKNLRSENGTLRTFLPCLGSNVNEKLNEDDYYVTLRDTQTINLFNPAYAPPAAKVIESSPMFGKLKTGVAHKAAAPDLPIRLNDGSAGGNYLALNDTKTVARIVSAMNETLLKSAKYIAGICANTCEPSANVLRQLGSNQYVIRDPDSEGSGRYLDIAKVVLQTYSYVPEKVIEEQFKFVKPLHYYSSARDDSTLKSSNDRETERIIVGNEVNRVSLRQHLDAVAKLGVSDGVTTDIQKKLDWLSKHGDGGIFTSLASAFQPVLNVGVSAIAQGLDSFV